MFSHSLCSYTYKQYLLVLSYLHSTPKPFQAQKSVPGYQKFFDVPEHNLLQETVLVLTSWRNLLHQYEFI